MEPFNELLKVQHKPPQASTISKKFPKIQNKKIAIGRECPCTFGVLRQNTVVVCTGFKKKSILYYSTDEKASRGPPTRRNWGLERSQSQSQSRRLIEVTHFIISRRKHCSIQALHIIFSFSFTREDWHLSDSLQPEGNEIPDGE